MITPEDIAAKSRRAYPMLLRSWLRNEVLQPITLPVGLLPSDYLELRHAVNRLLEGEKREHDFGYRVESEIRQTRAHGPQTLPMRVVLDRPEDLLTVVGKRLEFEEFQLDINLIPRV
jgi:Uncharacterized protein conserved in bacteria N-term (DUF3322)